MTLKLLADPSEVELRKCTHEAGQMNGQKNPGSAERRNRQKIMPEMPTDKRHSQEQRADPGIDGEMQAFRHTRKNRKRNREGRKKQHYNRKSGFRNALVSWLSQCTSKDDGYKGHRGNEIMDLLAGNKTKEKKTSQWALVHRPAIGRISIFEAGFIRWLVSCGRISGVHMTACG